MKIKHIIFSLTVAATLSSCGSFLEEYSQDHDYVRTWDDLNELLIGDCYMPVNTGSTFTNYSNPGMFLHLFSDELDDESLTSTESFLGYGIYHQEFGCRTWQDRLGANEDFTTFYTENTTWTKLYKYINVANNILSSAEKVPQTTDDEKAGVNYVKGQAHFLRAFYYFWLTNVYGQPYAPSTASTELGVPLKTSPEVKDIKYSRNTVQECYDLIISDLQQAEEELSSVKSISRKSIYRADSTSVQALLCRAYLYTQNWEQAAVYAKKVIKRYGTLENLSTTTSSFMLTTNPETIFSMGGDDLPRILYFGNQGMTVSQDLYKSYDNKDLRKTKWYWAYNNFVGCTKQPEQQHAYDQTNALYYSYNYGSTQWGISSLFWLRSGEAYLNLAEAEAYMGNEDEAREALNTLRENRYMSNATNKTITSTGSELITDIRNERKKELACEGHRWFDLRRYRVCAVQPEKVSLTHKFSIYEKDTNSEPPLETRVYTLGEDDPSWTAPIPYEVLDFNTGMPSNGNMRRTDYTTE
jgi:starch-binding outer membrane protein, SusD/RagB family